MSTAAECGPVGGRRVLGRIPAIVATLTSSSCHRGVEDLGGRPPGEDLAGSVVEALLDRLEVRQGVDAQSVRLGKYWRSSPLVFSLVPRCQGRCCIWSARGVLKP